MAGDTRALSYGGSPFQAYASGGEGYTTLSSAVTVTSSATPAFVSSIVPAGGTAFTAPWLAGTTAASSSFAVQGSAAAASPFAVQASPMLASATGPAGFVSAAPAASPLLASATGPAGFGSAAPVASPMVASATGPAGFVSAAPAAAPALQAFGSAPVSYMAPAPAVPASFMAPGAVAWSPNSQFSFTGSATQPAVVAPAAAPPAVWSATPAVAAVGGAVKGSWTVLPAATGPAGVQGLKLEPTDSVLLPSPTPAATAPAPSGLPVDVSMTMATAAKVGLLEGAVISGQTSMAAQSGVATSGISTGSGLSFVPAPRPTGLTAPGSPRPQANGISASNGIEDPPYSFVAMSGISGISSSVPVTAAIADSYVKVPTAGSPTAMPLTAALGDSYVKSGAVTPSTSLPSTSLPTPAVAVQATVSSAVPASPASKAPRRRKKAEVVHAGKSSCCNCW